MSTMCAIPSFPHASITRARATRCFRFHVQKSAAVLLDGKWVTLARADSAAQEKYSNGTYSLYLLDERAMLESNGRVVYGPCTSPVDLPTARRTR